MALSAMLQGWRTLSPVARLLVANGLAFNLGFYMMMPYLAQHIGGTLGLAGWAAGLVMGLRVFSQQGLFLLGGTLGDRIGYRPAIVWGCLVRSVGFGLLGWASSLPVLLLAAFLTGFAGALFTPCAQAYLASECRTDTQRQYAFSLHNLASEAGMLLGPLVGMVLTEVDYRVTGAVSGSVFLLLTLLQWHMLPASVVVPQAQAMGKQWRSMLRHRAFMAFTLLAAAYQVLFHQLYLAIPAYIRSVQHDTGLLGSVFTLTAVVGVTLQLPATRLVQRHLGVAVAMGGGLALMGLSYLALPLLSHVPVVAVLLQACLLSLGSILCFPLFAAHIPRFADPSSMGSYYGLYASVGGCVALLGNVIVGALLGSGVASPPSLIWYALALVGLACGWGIYHQVAGSKHHKLAETGTATSGTR